MFLSSTDQIGLSEIIPNAANNFSKNKFKDQMSSPGTENNLKKAGCIVSFFKGSTLFLISQSICYT